MLKTCNKKTFFFGLFIFLGIFLIWFTSFIFAQSGDWYRVVKNGGSEEIDRHGICWIVTNNRTDYDVFVPVKTLQEWQAFINSIQNQSYPENVVLNPCATTHYTLRIQSSPITGIPINGINTNYTESYSAGTAVNKTAPATHGDYTFFGWTGCDSVGGTGNRTCNITMNSDKLVAANYSDQGVCDECHGGAGCQPKTTFWLSGSYGCPAYSPNGKAQRCVNGVCRACEGANYVVHPFVENAHFYYDGCDGCANQGGWACWRAGYTGAMAESCNGVCSSYDGCVAANWNDDLTRGVQSHWADCGSGFDNWNWSGAPAFHGSACVHRLSTVDQSCSDVDQCWARVCVCRW